MASLAALPDEGIDKIEDLFFYLLEAITIMGDDVLNVEFYALDQELKEKITSVFALKGDTVNKYETVESITITLLKHLNQIKEYSEIINRVKNKLKGDYYSYEELRESTEMEIYRKALQEIAKKYKNSSSSLLKFETPPAPNVRSKQNNKKIKKNFKRNLMNEFDKVSNKKPKPPMDGGKSFVKKKRTKRKRRNKRKSRKKKIRKYQRKSSKKRRK